MKRLFIIFAMALLGATMVQAQTARKEINPVGFKMIYGTDTQQRNTERDICVQR